MKYNTNNEISLIFHSFLSGYIFDREFDDLQHSYAKEVSP